MTKGQIWITAGVAFYMVVMLLIGWWASRKVKTTEDYIIAGRRLSWGLSIGTIFATWFGAETCMGAADTARTKGILGVIADPFGAGLCLIIAGIFLAPFFHKMNIKTVIDYFEKRHNKSTGLIMSIYYVPAYIGWIGAQMLAFGTILSTLTSLPMNLSIFISAAVVIIYTYSGGMLADAVTDFVQMGFILICFAITLVCIVMKAGGIGNLTSDVPGEMFRLWPQQGTSTVGWLSYAQAWMVVGLGSLGGQDLISRLLSAKTQKVATWSAIISGLMYWTLGLIPVLLGIFAFKLLPDFKEGESVLIQLSLIYLPLPLVALMVGGLLSAVMSTIDTAMLAPASILGNNVMPHFKKDMGDKTKLFWCKMFVPILGIFSLVLALYFKNIYELALQSWTVLLTSFTAPLLFSMFWKRTNAPGVLTGSLGGLVAWLIFSFSLPEEYPVAMFGLIVSVVLILFVTLLTQKRVEAAVTVR